VLAKEKEVKEMADAVMALEAIRALLDKDFKGKAQ